MPCFSSTKSLTGHSLGGTGVQEAIYSILAIRDDIAPPTINLENPGEGCDLNYSANKATELTISKSISNAAIALYDNVGCSTLKL